MAVLAHGSSDATGSSITSKNTTDPADIDTTPRVVLDEKVLEAAKARMVQQDQRNIDEEQAVVARARQEHAQAIRFKAEGTWANLKVDLLKGTLRNGDYLGKQVFVRAPMVVRDNPIELREKDGVRCVVNLNTNEVKSVAHYMADSIIVSTLGTIKSIDVEKKRVEINSIESGVMAAQ